MDESSVAETALLAPPSPFSPILPHHHRRLYERRFPVYFVLLSTVFERLAFYSLAINLVVILQSSQLQWTSSSSTTASFIFFGVSYLSSLIFAVISDAKLGRAKTILIGFIMYFIGYVMIILIANEEIHQSICTYSNVTHVSVFSEQCGGQIIGVLIFLAIGIGAVQVNMAVFGAEQFEESKLAARYFDKYYFAVNIGGTLATLSIPLIQNPSNDSNNSNRFFYSYLIAMLMLIISGICFLLGYRYYVHIPSSDSVLLNCFPVIINAYQTKRQYRSSVCLNDEREIDMEEDQPISFLDYANVHYRGKFHERIIDDIKTFQRAIIVFLLLIPYGIIYHQIQITFPLQAENMKNLYLTKNELMPISWISLGDSITILLGIIILTLFVYKHLDRWNRNISIRMKLILGMIFAAIAMCIAGITEIVRQRNCPSSTDERSSSLSILSQLPQNICMGLSEIFANIASLEFAYLAAPRSGQTLFMSLQFCSLGISSFIGQGYLSIFPSKEGFDFRCSEYHRWIFFTYFFILAALQIVFLGIIILFERKYHILRINPQRIRTYQFQVD